MRKLSIPASGQTNLGNSSIQGRYGRLCDRVRTTLSSPTSSILDVGGLRHLELARLGGGGTLEQFLRYLLLNLTVIPQKTSNERPRMKTHRG